MSQLRFFFFVFNKYPVSDLGDWWVGKGLNPEKCVNTPTKIYLKNIICKINKFRSWIFYEIKTVGKLPSIGLDRDLWLDLIYTAFLAETAE